MLFLSAAVLDLFQIDIRSGCSIYVGQLYVPRRILVGPAVLRKTERELFIGFPARKSVISTQTCRIILSAIGQSESCAKSKFRFLLKYLSWSVSRTKKYIGWPGGAS